MPRPCPICADRVTASQINAWHATGMSVREILVQVSGFDRHQVNRHIRHSKERASEPDISKLSPIELSDAQLKTLSQRVEAAYLTSSAEGDTRGILEALKLSVRLATEHRERIIGQQEQQQQAAASSADGKNTPEYHDGLLKRYRENVRQRLAEGRVICPCCHSDLKMPFPHEIKERLPAILAIAERPDEVRKSPTSDAERAVQDAFDRGWMKCTFCDVTGWIHPAIVQRDVAKIVKPINEWLRKTWELQNPGKVWEDECKRFASGDNRNTTVQ